MEIKGRTRTYEEHPHFIWSTYYVFICFPTLYLFNSYNFQEVMFMFTLLDSKRGRSKWVTGFESFKMQTSSSFLHWGQSTTIDTPGALVCGHQKTYSLLKVYEGYGGATAGTRSLFCGKTL